MTVTDALIIDTDTHFSEPPDLWDEIPKKWSDHKLKVRWDDQRQEEVWVVGDHVVGTVWGFNQWGFESKNGLLRPARAEDAHPATYIQSERVKAMDDQGIRAQVLYPNLAGIRFDAFVAMDSLEIASAHIEIYNDYQLDWSLKAPGRFIPMLVIPFWDVARSVKEIERLKGRGFGGIVTTGTPQTHGQPYLADPHWNPLWEACVDAGLSVSYHIGGGDISELLSPERAATDPPGSALGRNATFCFMDNAKQVSDLLSSGVLHRYPHLKFVSVESGLGWIPFVLESLDYHFDVAMQSLDEHPFGGLGPSELFRRQVLVNFWFESLQQWQIDKISADNILFETDFPHPTSLEPTSVEQQLKNSPFANQPQDVQEKILWRNALGLYGKALDELEAHAKAGR